ncbi:lysine biosynthesis protein LysX [Thermoproteus tenax]|uniref:Lysine biosynthesis protein LysX/ribosomal protein S6 modification protein n=1 Tax=Thermoproteus tenax (strain ATCC 35583 / DSM 2078 / JCM 9277 / NBRC 100435 / Kra 1) TaxID=768679 RepID=G4RNI9_THETK|nr:lysine biosynthesis protein LysX [Thermoproteus tenax]CCC81133.1 lysine biosynthesis protein LysX/ribosomal protein S6 modification protein [Thermoproteus tenax Kra 1]
MDDNFLNGEGPRGDAGEIDLLYDLLRLDERLLIDAFKKRNIPIRLVDVEDLAAPDGFGRVGLVRVAGRSKVLPLAHTYESSGGISINSASSLYISHDKYLTYLALRRAGVPTPRTYLAFGLDAALKAAESLGYPVIVKPLDGSWGRLVNLAKSQEDLVSIISHKRHLEPSMQEFLVQEYVEKPGRDIRVTVVEGRAVAAIYRYAAGDWRTNTARGGRAEPVRIDQELEDISAKAAEAVGALYAGVDVVESREGYKVLEVNGVPEFKNVQRVTGVDVAGAIVEALLHFLRS